MSESIEGGLRVNSGPLAIGDREDLAAFEAVHFIFKYLKYLEIFEIFVIFVIFVKHVNQTCYCTFSPKQTHTGALSFSSASCCSGRGPAEYERVSNTANVVCAWVVSGRGW